MATYTSAATGLWSAGATWVGGVKPPSGAGHKIVIAATHVVTYDEAAGTYGDDTATGIQLNGTLKVSRAMSTALTCRGDLLIDSNGELDWGTEADPVPSTYVAQININDSAAPAHNKWGIRTYESTNIWNGFRMWGAAKTSVTTIPGGALAADTTFTVADATGWKIGDVLVFDATVAQGSTLGQVYRAITGISGNNVTVGANTGYDSQAGRRVANLTRNVRVVGVNGDTYRTQVVVRLGSTFSVTDAIEIGNCEIQVTGGHASNSYQFGGINFYWNSGATTTAAVKKVSGLVCHDIHSVVGGIVTTTAAGGVHINHFTNQAYVFNASDVLISSASQRTAVNFYNGTSCNYNNCTIIRAGNAFGVGYSHGPVECLVRNSYISGMASNIASGTGISIRFEDCVFDFIARYGSAFAAFGAHQYTRCTFGVALSVVSTQWSFSAGNLVPLIYEACTFKDLPQMPRTTGIQAANNGLYVRVRNANNDTGLQYLWDNGGEKLKDSSITHRGTQSIRFDTWFSGKENTYSRSIVVTPGQTITVVGYLRFNSTYGTTTPPVAAINGLGITPVTFTAPATTDTWHKFTLTATNPQAYSGEFTFTVTGQSTANNTGAYCWIDGVPFLDFVDIVRHYGYTFDGLAYRTVDTSISESDESVVAAYTEIDNIDKLHDRLNLWACENLDEAEFYTHAGDALDIGAYNLVVDATAATAFDITGTTITIKASTLAVGSIFAKVTTTGTITKANGAIISALYEDATGASARLEITLPLASMMLCVRDNTGAVVYCGVQSGTYMLLIDPGATGVWEWGINKQGYVYALGTFSPGAGGVFAYAPSCPQVLTPEGVAMYQGTTSALVQVTYTGGFGYIDIGNGTPPLQAIYDMVEDALYTADGIEWILDGYDGVSIFNSAGGDYLFLTTQYRLRRWHAGDVNATVPAFAQSVDGTPVDEVNGTVRYLTSDSPTAIASAVMAYTIETGKSMLEMQRLMSAVLLGKSSGSPTTPVFRDVNDTKNRVSGTVDANGNRTAVTVDAT